MEDKNFEKELVLMSESLREFLYSINQHTHNPIIEDLLYAQQLISIYNVTHCESFKVTLDSLITDYARMLTFRKNDFVFSFLPKGKKPVYITEDIWGRDNRQTGKPTRIIQKLIKRKYSNYEYEKLNNLLRSKMVCDGTFDIVEGEAIRYWYNCDNNESGGTLENSCMRYDECGCYLDVYVDHCKMLVLLNEDKSLIKGRALLWEIDGKTFMDRVYYSEDHYLDAFINYAEEHKFYHRSDNSLLEDEESQYWCGPEDDYSTPELLNLKVSLKCHYSSFPYIDSFRYYCPEECALYDHPIENCFYCSDTEGEIYKRQMFVCPCCGRIEYDRGTPENFEYCEHYNEYYCNDCCSYVEEDYVPNNDIVLYHYGDKECESRAIWNIPSDAIKIDGEYFSPSCKIALNKD